MKKRLLPFGKLSAILFILIATSYSLQAQSPKKLLANGYYEKAFVKATYKQNKKVKFKRKFTDVIYASYDLIYAKGESAIASANHDWNSSYNYLMFVSNYRARVKHPGVLDRLKNILHDENVIINLSKKYTNEYQNLLLEAQEFEQKQKFDRALSIYTKLQTYENQAGQIPNFSKRIPMNDLQDMVANAKQKMGDQYIDEAKTRLYKGTKQDANEVIRLVNKAKSYRPLDAEEEELITLANLIIRDSWIQEAQNLLQTRTKRNGRLAFDLINKTRTVKSLSPEEERMLQDAKALGMTRVRVVVKNKGAIHTSKNLSGILNKEKASDWITYYDMDSDAKIDLEMEVRSFQPTVVLGDVRKRVEQRSKTVEYIEQETDANGNTTDVKKTKTVTAIVAILSRTKDATISWSITLTDKLDGKTMYAETQQSVITRTNEFASVESGDILALPENIESEVALDSQPFPSDEEMTQLVLQLYAKELTLYLREKKDHLHNMDLIVD